MKTVQLSGTNEARQVGQFVKRLLLLFLDSQAIWLLSEAFFNVENFLPCSTIDKPAGMMKLNEPDLHLWTKTQLIGRNSVHLTAKQHYGNCQRYFSMYNNVAMQYCSRAGRHEEVEWTRLVPLNKDAAWWLGTTVFTWNQEVVEKKWQDACYNNDPM